MDARFGFLAVLLHFVRVAFLPRLDRARMVRIVLSIPRLEAVRVFRIPVTLSLFCRFWIFLPPSFHPEPVFIATAIVYFLPIPIVVFERGRVRASFFGHGRVAWSPLRSQSGFTHIQHASISPFGV